MSCELLERWGWPIVNTRGPLRTLSKHVGWVRCGWGLSSTVFFSRIASFLCLRHGTCYLIARHLPLVFFHKLLGLFFFVGLWAFKKPHGRKQSREGAAQLNSRVPKNKNTQHRGVLILLRPAWLVLLLLVCVVVVVVVLVVVVLVIIIVVVVVIVVCYRSSLLTASLFFSEIESQHVKSRPATDTAATPHPATPHPTLHARMLDHRP